MRPTKISTQSNRSGLSPTLACGGFDATPDLGAPGIGGGGGTFIPGIGGGGGGGGGGIPAC